MKIRSGYDVKAHSSFYPPRGWWEGDTYTPASVPPVITQEYNTSDLPAVPRDGVVEHSMGRRVEVPGRKQRPSGRGVSEGASEFFAPGDGDNLDYGVNSVGESGLSASWVGPTENFSPDRPTFNTYSSGTPAVIGGAERYPRSLPTVHVGELALYGQVEPPQEVVSAVIK